MTIKNYTLFCGIGDLLISRAMLPYFTQGQPALVSPYIDLIQRYHPNDYQSYIPFVLDFMRLIFTKEHGFTVTETQGIPHNVHTLCQKQTPKFIKLNNFLTLPDYIPPVEKYICIHTKARALYSDELNNIESILSLINKSYPQDYKVIVLGEKTTIKSIEYSHVKVNSFYDIIMKIIDKNRLIDMSLDDFEKEKNSKLKQLRKDCTIIFKAEVNLNIGIGGATCLAASCGNSVVYLPKDCKREFEDVNNLIFNNTENTYRTYDPNQTIEKMLKFRR